MAVKTGSLLTSDELAAELGLHPQTLRRWRMDERGPAWIQDGEGFIRYDRADIEAWKKSRRVVPASSAA